MKLLLDTHALVWWITDSARLSRKARGEIGDAEVVFASAVAAWEVSTKHRIGKWPGVTKLIEDFPGAVRRARFTELPLTFAHGLLAGSLPGPHRDPFDRMLMAQATLEEAILVTADPVFASYGIPTLWR